MASVILTNSLKRMYQSKPKKVTKAQLKAMVEKGQISAADYKDITGETYA
jgi:uncharacterized XkdX family phage protein